MADRNPTPPPQRLPFALAAGALLIGALVVAIIFINRANGVPTGTSLGSSSSASPGASASAGSERVTDGGEHPVRQLLGGDLRTHPATGRRADRPARVQRRAGHADRHHQALPRHHHHGARPHRAVPAAGPGAGDRQQLRGAGAQPLLRRAQVPSRGGRASSTRAATRRAPAPAAPATSSRTSRCASSTSSGPWPWPTAARTPTARSSSSASPTTPPAWRPNYNLFGKVASGIDVAQKIVQGDVMQTVTVAQQQ